MHALLLVASLVAASPLHQSLRDFVTEPEARGLEADLAKATAALQARASTLERCEPKDVDSLLSRLVVENLAQKHAMHFPLDAARIRRQVIAAEAFKVETFVATGVFPKRYFGYLDEQWDTAAAERRLKVAARKAAHACNRWLENAKAPFRVTEQELVVTFLAEGGAILLREKQDQLDSIHPVKDIGLDDIAHGFVDLAPLVSLLDAEVGTHLGEIVVWHDGAPSLSRNFVFEEAIAGTAAMWVWEKQIAEKKLLAAGRASLATRPLDEQFVITSLVYNSGVLFEEKTIGRIRALDTGAYVWDLSEANKVKRWPLPVLDPKGSLKLLLGGAAFPVQPTSWSAAYHVLQRYGGYVGLTRFTDAFDERGKLR